MSPPHELSPMNLPYPFITTLLSSVNWLSSLSAVCMNMCIRPSTGAWIVSPGQHPWKKTSVPSPDISSQYCPSQGWHSWACAPAQILSTLTLCQMVIQGQWGEREYKWDYFFPKTDLVKFPSKLTHIQDIVGNLGARLSVVKRLSYTPDHLSLDAPNLYKKTEMIVHIAHGSAGLAQEAPGKEREILYSREEGWKWATPDAVWPPLACHACVCRMYMYTCINIQ